MLCPKCKEDKQTGAVYVVSWKKWRENRINDWKNHTKRQKMDKKTSDYVSEYMATGYCGNICHDCNKQVDFVERDILDRVINTIETSNMTKGDGNEPIQNTLH